MNLFKILSLGVMLAVAPAAFGQKWEFGGGVGGGFYSTQTVKNPASSADASFENGLAGSVWLGQSLYPHVGGEVRYDFQQDNLELSSTGRRASFAGRSHALHYDFMLYASGAHAKIRPYVSFGGGVKMYQGTGREVVVQPLGNIALLTKANDTKGLLSVGAGLKFALTRGVNFRIEIRDAITMFPKKVIAPAAGSKVDGWLHDFVPMFGISFVF